MTHTDAGTPTWLAARNDRTAFRLFLEHGDLTRTRLGELSGMSKPTATQMIGRLERIGLIHSVGSVSGGRGPNAVSYGVRTDRVRGVAISVSARAIHAVVVDALETEHELIELPTEGRERGPTNDIGDAVNAACEAADVAPHSVSMVVVGVQAAVNIEGDALSYTDTLPGWPAVGSRAILSSSLDLDVVLENDVNLVAMAERDIGAARGASSFVHFWIGEGLGVGIDLGNGVHRGAAGGAGEIGYLEVSRRAARIDDDAVDFTHLLGGSAVARLLGARGDERLADVLPRLEHDDEALEALAARVVLALEPLVILLDPALVVLGGPTGSAGGERLALAVMARLDTEAHPALRVRPSSIGAQPVLLGARRLLVSQIRRQLEAGIAATD